MHRDGDDGLWSSFTLRVGNPEQLVRVLVSTAGTNTWVVLPQACLGASSDCANARGHPFNFTNSVTWKKEGIYQLGPNELNLGYNHSAYYGLETLSLGESNVTGGPTLVNQTVAAFANDDFSLGSFGLSNQPTNLTNLSNPAPSFLTSLYSQSLIPSISYGYTAGAHYRMFNPIL